MDLSEYVRAWRVQHAYDLTDILRDKLLASLGGIDGAVKECNVWWPITAPSMSIGGPLTRINFRADALYNSLLRPTVDYPPPPKLLLLEALRLTYEGERPEAKDLPGTFPGDDHFLQDHFRPLYLDSLLLRREDVRTYCRKNQIRQVREVKGLLWEDGPSPKADFSAPREPAATQQPPQPQPKARKKHGAISAGNAAIILGVSERTVRSWDAGINRPAGYPGRDDEAAFHLFANRYSQQKQLAETARAMNRPASGGGIADHFSRSAFDED